MTRRGVSAVTSLFQRAAMRGAVVCLAVAAHAGGDEAPPAAGAAPPAFRRIFIPDEDINNRQWEGRYLAVDIDELEGHLQTVHDGARGAPGVRRARLEKADYTLEVVDEDLLVGAGSLQFHASGDKPVLLALDPCSMALESARWQQGATEGAVLGADRAGRLKVLVEGRMLDCRLSQRGERTASGAVKFALQLPACPLSRIVLDAPAGQEVVADVGIITRSSAAAAGKNRWTIELGGRHRATLRIVSEDALRQRRPLTLLRQSLTYELTSRGINVAAQLRMDVHGEPLARAAIDVDRSLQLVGVRYGELSVPWSTATDAQSGRQRVLLEFPQPVEGTGRVLQLTALAPLATGRSFRLPGLSPQGMAWQEGTAELLILDPLVLDALVTDGCRQSRVTPLAAPRAGESIEIQYYRQDATIDVTLAEPRQRLAIASAALVEIGAGEITGNCALTIDVPPRARPVVRIPIRAPWTVDAVEGLEAAGPVTWDIEESPGRPAELKLVLTEPTRVVVRAVRPRPSAAAFDAGQLQILDLSQFAAKTRLLGVRAAEGWELHFGGALELKGRDAAALDAIELMLFSQPPEGLVFVEDESFASSTVTVARRKPNYTADIHIDAAAGQHTLNETYSLQITPDAARVERLLIHFSHARDVPLEWSLAGGTSGQFSARKLSAGEQAKAGLNPQGEVWELLLELARGGAFELRAQRSLPFKTDTPLALASVHDAATQRGTLAIRAVGETGLSINNRRLLSVPAELLEPDRYQTARATYHYQPSADELGAEPAVSIAPSQARQSETGAWAWTSRLESRYAAGGTCVHQATLHIQTAGRQQIRLQLPSDATLLSLWVDAASLPLDEKAADNVRLVDLPPGRSRATLSLFYSTSDTLAALVTRLAPPLPSVDMPVMLGEWSIWLPPGYEIRDDGRLAGIRAAAVPSWSQRLFGSLGRGEGDHMFNPLVASDWRESFAGSATMRPLRGAGGQFIDSLAALLSDYAGGEALTWGQLLSLLNDAEAPQGRALLVDAECLEKIGITPQARVTYPTAPTPPAAASGLLRDASLATISAPGVILLTSAAGAASYQSQLAPPDGSTLHAVAPRALAEELRAAALGGQASRYETVGLWRARLASLPPSSAWPKSVRYSVAPPAGWTGYRLQCTVADQPAVRIVHTATIRSLGWALFLATVALGFWKPLANAWRLVALVAIAAAVALAAPAAYAPLASAVLLAGLFCLAARLIQPEPARVAARDQSRGSHRAIASATQAVSGALVVAAVIHAAAALDAAQIDSANRPDAADDAPPVYRVYVPVDDRQQPSGDKCYVPETFYEELLRMAADVSGQPREWLVTRASYQGALARDPVTARLGLAELKARFDLRVFQARLAVRLPLARDSWGGVIAAARLDGRTIPVTWSDDGSALVLGPLAAERYRLELDLQPAALRDVVPSGLELPIPSLAQASLEFAVPQDAPPIEVRGARGQVTYDRQRGKVLARLGGADRLSLRWTAGDLAAVAPNLEAEELIWVKVRPGTTVLDARFKYRVLSGKVRQLQLLTDPRLSLLAPPDAASGITAHTIPGDPQRVDLELPRDVSDEVVVDLSFLVTGTSGVGNLRLPRLESAHARAARRWLGVSVDPALKPRIQAGEDSRAVDISEFLGAWGTSDDKPHAAYSIPRGEPIWVLSTRPGEPQTSVEHSLAVGLGRGSMQLEFDASLSITGGVLVQLGLEVPRGMAVDQISLLEDDVERVARWSIDAGRVNVFLTAPLDGRQKLSLRGRWTPAIPTDFDLPRVRLLAADVKKNELYLYRQPGVLATVDKSPAAVARDPVEAAPREGLGALHASYDLTDDTARVNVKLSPNEPELHAAALIYLEPDGDRWMAQLDYHVEVLSGLADALHFEIPPQWSEPFHVEPKMRWEVASIPGEQRRRLILHPAKPLAGKQQIRIRARVAPSPGDRLSAPDVVPLRVRELERIVALPRHLQDTQQVTWDTLGLVPAKLPVALAVHGERVAGMAVYRVAGEHFQASLKAVQHARALPRVVLRDIHLVWQADGTYVAAAAFDVQPAGSAHCVLELPAPCRLVHASVGQIPALVDSAGENRWRLTLGPQQLPQRIEVIYDGSLRASTSYIDFPAPRLVDLEIGQTLWTVYGPPAFGPAEARQSTWQINPAAQELERMQSMAALIDLAPEVLGEHLPEEIARWHDVWRRRYASARAAWRWKSIDAPQRVDARQSLAAGKLDERMRSIDKRLGAAYAASPEMLIGDATTTLASFARASSRAVHYLDRGNSPNLQLRHTQAPADPLPARLLTAAAVLLLGAAAAWWLRAHSLPTFTATAVAGGVGIAWWLLLAPSFLGLLAFTVAAGMALWSRWQVRPAPRTA